VHENAAKDLQEVSELPPCRIFHCALIGRKKMYIKIESLQIYKEISRISWEYWANGIPVRTRHYNSCAWHHS